LFGVALDQGFHRLLHGESRAGRGINP